MIDWISIQSYISARDKDEPVPNLEFFISQNCQASYFYALRVLRGPFKLGENSISTDPEWALRYARFIIKRRFKKAESTMARNSEVCYLYFKHVVKKKLPKRMHKAMISTAFKNPHDLYVAKYLEELGVLNY